MAEFTHDEVLAATGARAAGGGGPETDLAGRWQDTQLLVTPAWFISEPLNLAPSTTGGDAIDEDGPTWQTSQDSAVGRWLDGRPTMLKWAAGIANEGAAAPWHCAQLLVGLGALAWMFVSVGMTE